MLAGTPHEPEESPADGGTQDEEDHWTRRGRQDGRRGTRKRGIGGGTGGAGHVSGSARTVVAHRHDE